VAKIGICIGLAEGSWRLVEKPLLSLKDRFRYASRESSTLLKGPHAMSRDLEVTQGPRDS
jgi:hypothetical protein